MRRLPILLMVLGVALWLALPAGAAPKFCDTNPDHPACKDDPGSEPDPEIWTCQERVDNGAVWVPGEWNGAAYVSDETTEVDVPLCIDIRQDDWEVAHWKIEWSGEAARKAPKGLKFVFEEEVHKAPVYWQDEVSPTEAGTSWSGSIDVELDFEVDLDGVEHLVFVAMPRAGDKWTSISFTVTPSR